MVAPSGATINVSELAEETNLSVEWTPDAEEYLKRVSMLARGMARIAIEMDARERGYGMITLEDAERFSKKVRTWHTKKSR